MKQWARSPEAIHDSAEQRFIFKTWIFNFYLLFAIPSLSHALVYLTRQTYEIIQV